MKFLHVADLHLDASLRTEAARDSAMGESLRAASRQVLARLIDVAVAEGVDAVLLAGDTFDSDVADVASRAGLSVVSAKSASVSTVRRATRIFASERTSVRMEWQMAGL